jgi:hypothetical protein
VTVQSSSRKAAESVRAFRDELTLTGSGTDKTSSLKSSADKTKAAVQERGKRVPDPDPDAGADARAQRLIGGKGFACTGSGTAATTSTAILDAVRAERAALPAPGPYVPEKHWSTRKEPGDERRRPRAALALTT